MPSAFIFWLRWMLRGLLALLFLFAGIMHLMHPALFRPVMPPFFPFPDFCIISSGVLELLGGIGLLILHPIGQRFTGWGLVLLLIAVFPVNLYMAFAAISLPGIHLAPWMSWARLPLQPLLMLAVAWVTGIWPRQVK